MFVGFCGCVDDMGFVLCELCVKGVCVFVRDVRNDDDARKGRRGRGDVDEGVVSVGFFCVGDYDEEDVVCVWVFRKWGLSVSECGFDFICGDRREREAERRGVVSYV